MLVEQELVVTLAWEAIVKATGSAIKSIWTFNVSILLFLRLYDILCWHVLFYLKTVAPLCRPGQITSYNVGRGEIAKIQCEVEASPTDITFSWKFNTSLTESIDIVSSSITNDKTKSIAHYKPMTKYVRLFRKYFKRELCYFRSLLDDIYYFLLIW